MKRINIFLLAIFIVVADQLTKYLARHFLPYAEPVNVLGHFFRLTYIRNTGAAFSLSFGSIGVNRIIFIVISIIAIIAIAVMASKKQPKPISFSLGLILGGAVGNLLDRIFIGSVTDFLDADFPDAIMERWPIFNVADSSIVIALVIFFIYEFFISKKTGEN